LLELIILVLTVYWLLGFFGQSVVQSVVSIPHTGDFLYMLSVVIVVLIIMKFLS